MRFIYLMNIHQVLAGYSIIYLKGSQDIVAEMSDIGYLYVVS